MTQFQQLTPFDPLGAYSEGLQFKQQNALRRFADERGADLAAGDPNALRDYARLDPVGAAKLQENAFKRQQLSQEQQADAARRLLGAVAQTPPEARARAWQGALQQAQEMGLDVSSVPQDYPGDEQFEMMNRLFNMDEKARSDFAAAMEMIPEEQRQQAALVQLGLAPKAQAPNARQPASVQEFEYARQQGFTGSYQDFLGKKTPNTTVNVGAPNVTVSGPNIDKFSEETAKILAKEAGETVQVGNMARANLRALGRLSDLLAQSPQGVEGALVLALGEIGIPTEGLDAAQAARALINKMVPEQRAPGTGPMSDADLALFKESVPRIINQPGGNAIIIDTLRKIAEYDVKRGDIARQLQLGRITYDQAAEQWNALSDPLEEFRRDPATPPRGLPPEDWEAMTPEERALFK